MSDIFNNQLFEAFALAANNVYIYVFDMKTNISRWSKAAVEYFGLEGEYLKDGISTWYKHVHPDDLSHYMENVEGVFAGTKPYLECQYRARNAMGEYVWVECKGSVIRDAEGTPTVYAGLMTRIDDQSKYDTLTGLLTTYELRHFDFAAQSGAVMLIGIDGFRKVVSNYGYSAGDEILVEFAKKLKDLSDPKWMVFRFGGDEFLVVAFTATKENAQDFYARVCQETAVMELKSEQKVDISISAGGVLFPQDADSQDMLITKLERSLDYAKNNQRGALVFFSDEIAKKHQRGLDLREDLRQCIKNDFKGFELYFQPFVKPGTHVIEGCESLLRWKGEKIQDSYPMEFIKVLEDYGGIREVGFWVMEQAIKQQVAWRSTYGNLWVSFNVSYQQFMDDTFEKRLVAYAEKYGVDPAYIIIELTESCAVDNPQELSVLFDRLRERGFKIALDDFGTGYATLEMLKYLHVDYIKVEHSFVRELSEPGHEIDYVIIENLMVMCKRLGYASIVEGVENNIVADIVGKLDVTLLQGYYFSRPVCREDFEKMLVKEGGK